MVNSFLGFSFPDVKVMTGRPVDFQNGLYCVRTNSKGLKSFFRKRAILDGFKGCEAGALMMTRLRDKLAQAEDPGVSRALSATREDCVIHRQTKKVGIQGKPSYKMEKR